MKKEFSTPEAERDYKKFKKAMDKKYGKVDGMNCEKAPDGKHCWHELWTGHDPCNYHTIGRICCWCGVKLIKYSIPTWVGNPEQLMEKHGDFENWNGQIGTG